MCGGAPAAGFEDGVHGCNGLMRVENPRYTNPLHDRFFEAAAQAGIPANANFNNWGHTQARCSVWLLPRAVCRTPAAHPQTRQHIKGLLTSQVWTCPHSGIAWRQLRRPAMQACLHALLPACPSRASAGPPPVVLRRLLRCSREVL